MTKRKPKPFCLPSNYNVLKGYIQTHKKELYNHVIQCLEYGIKKKPHDITVFTFDQSKYTISLSAEDFDENVEFLYKTFITEENYELCSQLTKIKKYVPEKIC